MKRDGAVELAVRDELARMESVVVGLAVVKTSTTGAGRSKKTC
jgi:hypothetical protein